MDPIVAFEVSSAGAALPLAPGAPRLSRSFCEVLRNVQVIDEAGVLRAIQVPEERALTILIDGHEIVTLMTLGGAPELMVLGFLLNQRFIATAASLHSIDVDWDTGTARVTRCGPVAELNGKTERTAATGSGHGSVYSKLMNQISSVCLPSIEQSRMSRAALLQVLESMRQHDAIHRIAGSVHSCGLFLGAELLVCIEDVGRHNGIDTITGWMAMHCCPGGDKLLFTTGRLTSEMVMKTANSGIPIAISRNGVSAMGYDLAAHVGMTLIGRAAKQRFLCYVGAERLSL